MAKKSRAFDHSKYQFWIRPEEVEPYEKNSKIHTEKQVKNIANSINRFGWQQDVVITSDNVLVIGHGRRLAALKIGCEMPYHRIDKAADELTDKDIRELRIADNQTNAETGLDFDTLNIEIEDLDFAGFDFDFQNEEPAGILDFMTNDSFMNKDQQNYDTFSISLEFNVDDKPSVTDYLQKYGKADLVRAVLEVVKENA